MKKNRRRVSVIGAVLILCMFGSMLTGCMADQADVGQTQTGSVFPTGELTVGSDITFGSISDFFYTYENINYNAHYQRYRFFTEDGAYLFYHETRERKDDYGPTTENDITLTGSFALSEDEWAELCAILDGGTVRKRSESNSTGYAGPWLYLYWDGDNSVYQEYSFASYSEQIHFEEFCLALAQSGR